ncbi:MAG: ABC transporter substrate-binding protein, partial [Steroidobacteraceae bacterium]
GKSVACELPHAWSTSKRAPNVGTTLAPHRIGYLQDWMIGTQSFKDQFAMSRFAFDEAYEQGLLDRPVELVLREVEGPPYAQVHPIIATYNELIEKGQCIGVIGPFITDVTKPLRKVIERARIPTLSYCATVHFAGEYCFQIPNGTFIDETALITRHLQKLGVKTVGVIREDNSMADEYVDFFRHNARLRGIAIATDQLIATFVKDPAAEIEPKLKAIRDSGAQAIAFLAYGQTTHQVATAFQKLSARWNWNVPRVTVTTWVGVTCPGFTYFPEDIRDRPELLEGWVGVDQLDERNTVFQAVLDRFERKHGYRPLHCYASCGYDLGQTMALALSRAKPATPEALKVALESIRMLPAATGGAGTVISFGPHERRGYKGLDYVTLRTVHKGEEMLAARAYPELYPAHR